MNWLLLFFFFFFNDTATTEIYTLSLHDALPILREGKFQLIETAADRVAGRLLDTFPIARLRLELRKPIADGGYTAVITIERPLA